jgi:hypothetical protein
MPAGRGDVVDQKSLQGLGGWLVLVSIGVVLSPIRMVIGGWQSYIEVFGAGTLAELMDPSSSAYRATLMPLLVFESVGNLLLFGFSIFAIYLFFQKKLQFPKLYSAFLVIIPVFLLLDGWLSTLVFPEVPASDIMDEELAKDIFQSIVACSIWVPYFILSKRVKATFVN